MLQHAFEDDTTFVTQDPCSASALGDMQESRGTNVVSPSKVCCDDFISLPLPINQYSMINASYCNILLSMAVTDCPN